MSTTKRSEKKPWFKEISVLFWPISWQGAVVTGLAIFFCIHIFIAIDSHSHSNSDTLYGIFPYVIPTFLLWYLIAWRTAKQRGR
jgi:hypothetical protein